MSPKMQSYNINGLSTTMHTTISNISTSSLSCGSVSCDTNTVRIDNGKLILNDKNIEEELKKMEVLKRLLIQKGLITEQELDEILDSINVAEKLSGEKL